MFDLIFRLAAAIGLICALIYWIAYSWRDGSGWARSLIKTLALAPLAAFWVITGGLGGTGDWPMAAGLCLGVLGDFLLSRPGQRAFLAGVAAFGLGHLAYALGLLSRATTIGLDPAGPGAIAAVVLLAGLVASTEIWLAPRTGGLRGPVRAYVGLIALMALAAIALPQTPGQAELRLGAAFFLLSDLLLAIRLFVVKDGPARAWLGAALWPAYIFGQALIFWGSLLLFTFPRP